jgi:branched-chain amino acid transport system permease protein
MLTTVAIFLDGLNFAAWLFLASAGLTMIYGVMRILNIAHGSFYAFGAYTAAMFVGLYSSTEGHPALVYLFIFLAAITVGALLGLAIERGFLRFMYKSDEVLMVLVTYALFLILEDAAKLIWGVDPYFAFQPYAYLGLVEIFGLPYQIYDLALIALAILCGVLLWWGMNKTRVGKLLLVVIEDREISAGMGIDVAFIFTITFVIGATLGALGGAVTAPKISVNPGLGVEVIVMAFAVVVIGGLGSIGGAMVGSVIVGFSRAASVHLFPEVELFAIYGVMALVLAIKPYGLFARAEGRKI